MQNEIKELGLSVEDVEVFEKAGVGDEVINFIDRLTDAATVKTDNDVTLTKQTLIYGAGLIVLAGLVFYVVKKS